MKFGQQERASIHNTRFLVFYHGGLYREVPETVLRIVKKQKIDKSSVVLAVFPPPMPGTKTSGAAKKPSVHSHCKKAAVKLCSKLTIKTSFHPRPHPRPICYINLSQQGVELL